MHSWTSTPRTNIDRYSPASTHEPPPVLKGYLTQRYGFSEFLRWSPGIICCSLPQSFLRLGCSIDSLTLNVYPLFPSARLKGQLLLMEQWLCYSYNYLSLPLNSWLLCLQSQNKGLSGWWRVRAEEGPGNAITPFFPAPTCCLESGKDLYLKAPRLIYLQI